MYVPMYVCTCVETALPFFVIIEFVSSVLRKKKSRKSDFVVSKGNSLKLKNTRIFREFLLIPVANYVRSGTPTSVKLIIYKKRHFVFE